MMHINSERQVGQYGCVIYSSGEIDYIIYLCHCGIYCLRTADRQSGILSGHQPFSYDSHPSMHDFKYIGDGVYNGAAHTGRTGLWYQFDYFWSEYCAGLCERTDFPNHAGGEIGLDLLGSVSESRIYGVAGDGSGFW